jgi:hypothetical protein
MSIDVAQFSLEKLANRATRQAGEDCEMRQPLGFAEPQLAKPQKAAAWFGFRENWRC